MNCDKKGGDLMKKNRKTIFTRAEVIGLLFGFMLLTREEQLDFVVYMSGDE